MQPEILCNQVTRTFGDVRAVSNLTFDVTRGRVCALLGPNGAGKSTLVNMLSGLLLPTSGSVQVAEIDTRAAGPDLSRAIGVVPEGLALFDDLTIEEHLSLSGSVYGLDTLTAKDRAGRLLRALGLNDVRKRFLRDCSHGMRKKTALALALLHAPRVVILDEPFEGIDPVAAEAMRMMIRRMAQRGVTVLLTSHILPLVKTVADDVMLVRHGELVWKSEVAAVPGSLEDLYFDLVECPADQDLSWLRH